MQAIGSILFMGWLMSRYFECMYGIKTIQDFKRKKMCSDSLIEAGFFPKLGGENFHPLLYREDE